MDNSTLSNSHFLNADTLSATSTSNESSTSSASSSSTSGGGDSASWTRSLPCCPSTQCMEGCKTQLHVLFANNATTRGRSGGVGPGHLCGHVRCDDHEMGMHSLTRHGLDLGTYNHRQANVSRQTLSVAVCHTCGGPRGLERQPPFKLLVV